MQQNKNLRELKSEIMEKKKEGSNMYYQVISKESVSLDRVSDAARYIRESLKKSCYISEEFLNHYIDSLDVQNLSTRVKKRISKLKNIVRIGAIGLEEIKVGASEEFMKKTEIEEQEQYFKDSLHFIQEYYGKENVMYCMCDRYVNPHIVVGVVPITKDGKLSAHELFSTNSFEEFQIKFNHAVGLKYGLSIKESYWKEYMKYNKPQIEEVKKKIEKIKLVLNTERLSDDTLYLIERSAYNPSIFGIKDKKHIQLPVEDYEILKGMVNEGIKLVSEMKSLQIELEKFE